MLLLMALGGSIAAMVGFLTADSLLFYGGGICAALGLAGLTMSLVHGIG